MVSPIDVAAFLKAFGDEAAAQGFEQTIIAETPAGPVAGFTQHGKGKRRYLSAGIHGDEPAGPLAMLELLKSGFFNTTDHWILCPALNPEGLTRGIRENESGADLNRDYLRLQTAEIMAHSAWLRGNPIPELFISLHEDWESSGFYLYEINLGEDDPTQSRLILEAASQIVGLEEVAEIDGHETRGIGWIYHGDEADLPDSWPEAIFMAKLGCPLSFTFETPSQSPLADRVRAHVCAVKAAIASGG